MKKITKSFYLPVVAAAIVLGFILSHQNKIASGSQPGMDYLTFNRSEAWEAQQIMDYWRSDSRRTNGVKRIVFFDYLLIVLYTVALIRLLNYRRNLEREPEPPNKKRYWIIVGLSAALFCIVSSAALDAAQDGVVFYWASLSTGPISSLQLITKIKWAALLLGVFILLVSLIPHSWLASKGPIAVAYISNLLKTIWTFFRFVLFIFLFIY